jgi:HEAT repeat protein
MLPELREYSDQARVSPQHQALWDLQRGASDETESEMLRRVCIDAVARISNDQYVIDLRPLTGLKTREATVRRAAIKAATEVRPHPRHDALIADELAECEQSNIFTLRSLVSSWGARAGVLRTIDKWRGHEDPGRRSEAAHCLAWLGDTSLAIHNLAHDPDPGVRQFAAFSLGFFGSGTPPGSACPPSGS